MKLYTPKYGHFDPLVLSIVESDRGHDWRNKVDTDYVGDKFKDDLFGSLKQRVYNEMSDEELLGYMTSCHENDHFAMHTSSEIGLLVTFTLLIRHYCLTGYWQIASNHERMPRYSHALERTERNLLIFNTAFASLWDGQINLTQQGAVAAINWVLGHFTANEEVFITSTPDEPASPAPFLGYRNVLEASALFWELNFLLVFGLEQRHNQLLRVQERTSDVYWDIFNWLQMETHALPGFAQTAVRIALDARVPYLGSPFRKPIEWSDFHPGWRLVKQISGLSDFLSKQNIQHIYDNPKLGYAVNIQRFIIDDMTRIAEIRFKNTLWHDDEAQNYEQSFDLFESRLSEAGREALGNNVLFSGKPVLDHLLTSHNNFKKKKVQNPLGYFCDALVGFDLSQRDACLCDFKANDHVIFSHFPPVIGSKYLTQKPAEVVNTILLHIRSTVLDMLLTGRTVSEVIRAVKGRYHLDHEETDKILQEQIKNNLEYSFGIKI